MYIKHHNPEIWVCSEEYLRDLLRRVTEALYDAVRMDWDRQPNHDTEAEHPLHGRERQQVPVSDQ